MSSFGSGFTGPSVLPPLREFLPGETIDEFKIVDTLGSGGFGRVYEALDTKKERPVALKQLHAEFEHWFREAFNTAAFDHDAIVGVEQVRVGAEGPYIVLELLKGQSLRECIAERPMCWQEALGISHQVAEALEHAHGRKRVHGDLHPGNVFLAQTADAERVKLIDFGAARQLKELSEGKLRCGVPGFAAPEGMNDACSDVFSAAMVLHYCLTNGHISSVAVPGHGEPEFMTVAPSRADIEELRAPRSLKKLLLRGASRYPEQRVRDGKAWLQAVDEARRWAWLGPISRVQLAVGLMLLIVACAGAWAGQRMAAGLTAQFSDLRAQLRAHDEELRTLRLGLESLQQQQLEQRIARLEDYDTNTFVETVGGVAFELRPIPSGSFTMGSPDDEPGHETSEAPMHRVHVPRFYLGKSEVTNEQWDAVARDPHTPKGVLPDTEQLMKRKATQALFGPQRPVVNVNWDEAIRFVRQLGELTGRCYRLPTESEWEYAARGGTEGPFGIAMPVSVKTVNYNGRAYGGGRVEQGRGTTINAGSLPSANAFGLHEMHANVWEWCQDQWSQTYDGVPNDGSAFDPASTARESNRVVRGGSWTNGAERARSAARLGLHPRSTMVEDVGLRIALTLAPCHLSEE